MSDPLRSDPRPAAALTLPERSARIEQLLLSGLDRYFAGDYEQAINLWTRVLFVDRQHDRARAYIERARSAQAERQRESDALAHEGLQAFQTGDVGRARDLLSAALDRGGAQDLALGVLGRIERLDVGSAGPPELPLRREMTPVYTVHESARDAGGGGVLAFVSGCVLLTLIALSAFIGLGGSVQQLTTWMSLPQAPSLAPPPAAPTVPLVMPAAREARLAAAHRLFDGGHVRDALAALDDVPPGDPLRPEADKLRARIQHMLLETVAARPTGTAAPGPAAPGPAASSAGSPASPAAADPSASAAADSSGASAADRSAPSPVAGV